MIKWEKKVMLCALFLFWFLSGISWSAEFTADMTVNTKIGEQEMIASVKCFVKGASVRLEMKFPEGVETMIIPGGEGVMYTLLVGKKMYTETANIPQFALDDYRNFESVISQGGGIVSKKWTETIEGYFCEVYQIEYTDRSLGENTIWVSQDLNYILKSLLVDQNKIIKMTLKNISRKSLDNSLFTVPKGYTKVLM